MRGQVLGEEDKIYQKKPLVTVVKYRLNKIKITILNNFYIFVSNLHNFCVYHFKAL
jgi:hypothetical protein